jgi:uncharacterized protein (TIGR00730 family)
VQTRNDAAYTAAATLARDTNDTIVGDAKALHTMKRVCIFCGARPGDAGEYLELASKVGAAIARAGYGLVFGGGRVGLMGAAANAALDAGGEVIGVIPESLATAEVAHHDVTRLHVVSTMHERKSLMAELSDAFVALPGGIGTMDELCEIVTWRQLGYHSKPIALLNHHGYYDRLVELFDEMAAKGFLPPPTREFLIAEPTIEDILTRFR